MRHDYECPCMGCRDPFLGILMAACLSVAAICFWAALTLPARPVPPEVSR